MEPITVFCPFTRLEMVNRWFDDLESTDLDPGETNLAFIVDCGADQNGPKIYKRLNERIEKSNFYKYLILRNYDNLVYERHIPKRRKRIAEIHEQAKSLVENFDAEFVLGLEDDTVFTGLNVRLLWEKARLDQVGFCTAYEAGRWNQKMIGVWQFDNVNDPRECWTMLPGQGYEEIDAAGFYAYVTRKIYFVGHNYETETWQPWGPDVNFGLWLRQMGLTNYVDWQQPMGHYDQGIVITPDHQLVSEHFVRDSQTLLNTPAWERRRQTT
jgi:hypothetical protein